MWVSEYIRKRVTHGAFNTLMHELSAGEKYFQFQYLRMDVDILEELYALVEPGEPIGNNHRSFEWYHR